MRSRWTQLAGFAAMVTAMRVMLACSDVTTPLTPARLDERDGSGPSQPQPMPSGDAAPASDASEPIAAVVFCGKKPCACNDGKDNDGDGLIDGQDPECTAPFDNDEESFATGRARPGPNTCEDCFWDGNTDFDDDGCAYAAVCRSEGPDAVGRMPMLPPPVPAMCRTCEVTQRCIDSCRPITPNGCDCFGCCAVSRPDGSIAHIELGEDCSLAHIGDEARCPPCVQNTECLNPCGRCELCLGRTEALPADCVTSTSPEQPPHQCDEGYNTCSATTPCPESTYCVLGCCLFLVE